MGIFGEPDAELEDLLGEVDAIQQAARRPIRHGARGGDVFAAAEELMRRSSYGNSLEFVAHGMGLISHEAPRLTDRGPVPYPAHDADLPLQKGMVLSIETTISILAGASSSWRTRSRSPKAARKVSETAAANGTGAAPRPAALGKPRPSSPAKR